MGYGKQYITEIGLSFLMIVLGLPLALNVVPPNHIYGFRVQETLADPLLWYKINHFAGLGLSFTGIATLLGCFLASKIQSTHSWGPFIIFCIGMVLSFLWSFSELLSQVRKDEYHMTLPVELYFVGLSLLIIVLSIPLALKLIKPNHIYGFRVKQTLSNESTWYQVNSYSGRYSVITGMISLICAIVLRYLIISLVVYEVVCTVVLVGGLLLTLLMSIRLLKRL